MSGNSPKLVLSTIGISLLLSHQTPTEREVAPRRLIDLANATTLTPEDEGFINALSERVTETLDRGNIALIRRKSAELNGIFAIYENQQPVGSPDMHVLVATDTYLGRRCATLVERYLQSRGLSVITYIPASLTTADTHAFETGIKELIYWCAENIPSYQEQGYSVLFNLVAAFKSLQGYLNTIGMFYADQILYLFEGASAQPIYIPRLPLKIDLDRLQPYATQLAMMAEGDAVVAVNDLDGLPSALYDQVNQDAIISQWGLLTWQQIRSELFKTDLLAFPRLHYKNHFQREVKGLHTEEKVRLQAVLAKVATVLVESNGDVVKLKQTGGIQYDNYVNKKDKDGKAIGHFRVSDGIRVSCVAKDGQLFLRHYGQHDDVNDNP